MMLDKNSPYSCVRGEAPYRYKQNGKMFNAQFKQVDTLGRAIVAKKKVSKTKVSDDG